MNRATALDPAFREFHAALLLSTQIDPYTFSAWIFENWDALEAEFQASGELPADKRTWYRLRFIERPSHQLPRVPGAKPPLGLTTPSRSSEPAGRLRTYLARLRGRTP